MKNSIKVALIAANLTVANCVFADALEVNAETDIVSAEASATAANSKSYTITPVASRGGFVKNTFNITLSAYTALTVVDTGKAFAVASASYKGDAVFTGHSDGGSVTQCGENFPSSGAETAVGEISDRLDATAKDACSSNTSS